MKKALTIEVGNHREGPQDIYLNSLEHQFPGAQRSNHCQFFHLVKHNLLRHAKQFGLNEYRINCRCR